MKRSVKTLVLLLVMFTCGVGVAHADTVTVTLGTQSATADGSLLTIAQWIAANPSPLFAFSGFDDNVGPSFSNIMNFGYTPIAGNILSASLTLGIYDHDSATAGNQVSSFSIDGTNLTTEMNAVFETPGAGQTGFFTGEFNIFTLNLGSGLFSSLSDGSASASLALQNGMASSSTTFNGASISFARLVIETADTQPPTQAPEPASFVLLLAGIPALAALRKRSR
jgi:hypothetical protein